jgi:mono/diheme cytochrome c family protein
MKIPITLQLVVLTVLMTAFYAMVGQSVPQKEVHPPEIIEMAEDISTEEMVEIGRGIYEGKGICYTCHANTSRYPDLQGIATRAATRKPGYTAVDYIAESLYEPGAYIVEGFNPGMPVVNKPPIGLTDQEILAVIAYLQTLGGEPTVTMQTKLVYTGGTLGGGEATAAATDASGEVVATAESATAESAAAEGGGPPSDALAAYGCSACHYSDRPDKLKAVSLYDVGSRLAADEILLRLGRHERDPSFDRVTLGELENLVQTLSQLRGQEG